MFFVLITLARHNTTFGAVSQLPLLEVEDPYPEMYLIGLAGGK